MLLDKKENLIENLELVKKSYLKLLVLKQHEHEAYEKGSLEILYELSEHERMAINDVNGIMKYIAHDLLFLRDDPSVKKELSEIDEVYQEIINKTLLLKKDLKNSINKTKDKIKNLDVFPKGTSYFPPSIVNIRA